MSSEWLPGVGPGAAVFTSSSGCGTDSGRRRISLKSEKIAAFAPMPSASDSTATPVTKGLRKSARMASLKLGISGPSMWGRRFDSATGANGLEKISALRTGPTPSPPGGSAHFYAIDRNRIDPHTTLHRGERELTPERPPIAIGEP